MINLRSIGEYSYFEESVTDVCFCWAPKQVYIYRPEWRRQNQHSQWDSQPSTCGNLQALDQLRIRLKGHHLRFTFRYAFFSEWREISNYATTRTCENWMFCCQGLSCCHFPTSVYSIVLGVPPELSYPAARQSYIFTKTNVHFPFIVTRWQQPSAVENRVVCWIRLESEVSEQGFIQVHYTGNSWIKDTSSGRMSKAC